MKKQEMIFRKAEMRDLAQLKAVYKAIIVDMNQKGIEIWDEVYPCAFFEDDIRNSRLYVLADGESLVSAFAITETNDGEHAVEWPNPARKAVYLDRFAVNVPYARRGIGSRMLDNAIRIARQMGAEFLRLFVVDCNYPAIALYERKGFQKASGVFCEVIDDALTLPEYGYEIKTVSSKNKKG